MITAAITHGMRNTARSADRRPAETVCSARARPVPRAIEPTRVPVVNTAVIPTTLRNDGACDDRTAWKFLRPTCCTLRSRPIVAPVVE